MTRKYRIILSAAFLMLLLSSVDAFSANYYVDCSFGSDSSGGTSQQSPWRHHPYMVGFTGSYSHAAGDQFYFKGGTTCPNSFFPLTVANGGSVGAGDDYYGPDPSKAWFSGGSWTQPIFDMQGSVVAGNNNIVEMTATTHVTFDNFNMTGMHWTGSPGFGQVNGFVAKGDFETIKNCFFHGWSYTGTTADSVQFVQGNGTGQDNSLMSGNTVSGTDASPASTSALHGSGILEKNFEGSIVNNLVHDVSNGFVGSTHLVTGNVVYNIWSSFDVTNHENGIEVWLPASGGTLYVMDNIVHDVTPGCNGSPIGCGFSFAISTYPNSTVYLVNNTIWGTPWGQTMQLAGSCSPGSPATCNATTTLNIWGNTMDGNSTRANDNCIIFLSNGTDHLNTVSLKNNHCISDAGSGDTGLYLDQNAITTLTKLTNLTQTAAASSGQGYTTSNSFRPTTGGSTIGAGTNLVTAGDVNCSGSLTQACSDASGQWNISGTGFGSGTDYARPGGSAVDIGAYELGSGGLRPSPPTGLTASVQ